MKNQKGFVVPLIIAIIAILGIGGGTYVYVNKNNTKESVADMSDWKTYKNEKYGFEFKYPSEISIKNNQSIPSNQELSITISGKNSDYAELTIVKIPNGWVSQDNKFINSKYYDTEKNFLIDNFSAIKILRNDEVGTASGGKDERIQIIYNNLLVDFSKSIASKIDIENIAKTLKFTTPTKDQTSDWKTYKNEQVGFEFKYPTDWILDSSKEKTSATNRYDGITVTLYKKDYKFEVHFPSAFSPSGCFYEGEIQPKSENELGLPIYKKTDYVELKSSTMIFRRFIKPRVYTENKIFDICQNDGGKKFSQSQIHYIVPVNYDSDTISQMDEILKTFKFTTPTKDQTSDWKTYKNEKYGFEFKYPKNLSLKINKLWSDNYTQLVSKNEETISSEFLENKDTTFEKSVEFLIKNICSADGDGISINCPSELQRKQITTTSGIIGYRIYLDEVEKNIKTQMTTSRERGPIFILNLSENTYATKMLVINGTRTTFSDTNTLENIVSTIKFTK